MFLNVQVIGRRLVVDDFGLQLCLTFGSFFTKISCLSFQGNVTRTTYISFFLPSDGSFWESQFGDVCNPFWCLSGHLIFPLIGKQTWAISAVPLSKCSKMDFPSDQYLKTSHLMIFAHNTAIRPFPANVVSYLDALLSSIRTYVKWNIESNGMTRHALLFS